MKKNLSIIALIFTGLCLFAAETPAAKYELKKPEGEPVAFKESWGHVVMSRADEYKKEMPVTDVCFFAASVDTYGKLCDIPNRKKIDIGNARAHMVVVCDSKSLTHFVLDPKYDLRKQLIKDIVAAAEPFDGVQLDFELIPNKDRNNLHTFIADLRYKLREKGKMFTVCVPARTKLLTDDIWPYAKIADYCDRVFIMAYDQHWSTSKPGPIAGVDWCERILKYAQETIPEKKLIMGIPFYGRTWNDKTTAQAWYFSGANRIMRENNVSEVNYIDDIPSFKYTTTVNVTGYFNDTHSLLKICRLYEEAGVPNIGFWRIGQEDPDFWNWLKIK